jgi:hypothetical protein
VRSPSAVTRCGDGRWRHDFLRDLPEALATVLAKRHSAIDARLSREIDTSIQPERVPRLVFRLPCEIKVVIGITNPWH